METGAVKHALNNEIIHTKKKLNQAKIQIIHKLTRKAKILKTKEKPPENIKEKLQRKAQSAVAEVLILKKVQAKELIRFAISHKGSLSDFLKNPNVDNEKVYAKLLLHKALSDKYKSLRERFANMPVDQLLITRKERLKLKKEQKEANKNKSNRNEPVVTEDVNKSNISETEEHENILSGKSEGDDPANEEECQDTSGIDEEGKNCKQETVKESVSNKKYVSNLNTKILIESLKKLKTKPNDVTKAVKDVKNVKKDVKSKHKKPVKKAHSNDKDKNDEIEVAPIQAKVVDSFFITSTGDNYMTLAEPRQPDEVKEIHQNGNRRMRRAEIFGNPKPFKSFKPRNDNFSNQPERFGANRGKYEKTDFSKTVGRKDDFKSNSKDFTKMSDATLSKRKLDAPPEKLHPSWEAKKQKSGIVAFQGKKVVF